MITLLLLQMAGHSFLLSSTHQLRQVLFDELALHEKCQRSLSKTASQKFTSTSEHVVVTITCVTKKIASIVAVVDTVARCPSSTRIDTGVQACKMIVNK